MKQIGHYLFIVIKTQTSHWRSKDQRECASSSGNMALLGDVLDSDGYPPIAFSAWVCQLKA